MFKIQKNSVNYQTNNKYASCKNKKEEPTHSIKMNIFKSSIFKKKLRLVSFGNYPRVQAHPS